MEAPTRTLVVMRHAKAEPHASSDFERELSEQGRADAAAAGAWLAERGLVAQEALVSAAHRTRQTWEELADAAGWSLAPRLDRGLYAAGVDTALDLLREVDEATSTLIVVGHNPTMAYLAQVLDDGDGDVEAATAMLGGYPTSALAVFEVAGGWHELGPGLARLAEFHVGRA